MESNGVQEFFYAPVFLMGRLRFVWFAKPLLAGSPQEAKKIGLELEKGYAQSKLPVLSAQSVAKFRAEGQYALAMIGPEGNQRPVIALNPGEMNSADFEGGEVQQAETSTKIDPVEEIAYDQIGDVTFVKSAKW